MNQYEKKVAGKKARDVEHAEALRKKSDELALQASEELSLIPPGQPILVGHHSERKHRRHLDRIDSLFRQSHELSEKAKLYEERASIKSNAISSDDEDAIAKLTDKRDLLKYAHKLMKELNSLCKKKGKAIFEEHLRTKIEDNRVKEILEEERSLSDISGKPFPDFALTGIRQQIKRTESRISVLEREKSLPARKDIHGNGYCVKDMKEDNRIHFIFDGKPNEEVRTILKSNGFKWSRSRHAWIRMLNVNGRNASRRVVAKIDKLMG